MPNKKETTVTPFSFLRGRLRTRNRITFRNDLIKFSFLRGRLRTKSLGLFPSRFESFSFLRGRLRTVISDFDFVERVYCFHSFEVGFGRELSESFTVAEYEGFHSFEVGFGPRRGVASDRFVPLFSFLRGRLRTAL